MAKNNYVLNYTGLSKNRSSWIQSKSHKTSIPFGKVVPLGKPIRILPGDTFALDMGAILRMLTPKAPLMDSISGDIYAYFVPNRLVFDKTKEFFGQNESQAWTLNLTYTEPSFSMAFPKTRYSNQGTDAAPKYVMTETIGGSKLMAGSLFDHFELPIVYLNAAQYSTLVTSADSETGAGFIQFSALPFRGYQLIWNEDFRNPSVVDPMLDFNYDANDVNLSDVYFATHSGCFDLKPVMRYRDLFSSALKSPQRGPSALIPLGTLAPVISTPDGHSGNTSSINLSAGSGHSQPAGNIRTLGLANKLETSSIYGELVGGTSQVSTADNWDGVSVGVTATNLWADLSSAAAATINTLRMSIAVQHLYEMMTNAFRYQEYTEVFFGVRGADATLQRPQHLGGLHFKFNVNQVVSTTQNSDADLGQTGAFGLAEVKGHVYTNSFTEHGMIFLLLVLRKEHTYVQGLDKDWRYREFLDYPQPPLFNIGNVDIKNSEVWFGFNASGFLDDAAFGYTEPYYECRYMTSKACALMNPLAPGSLSFYSLTDVLTSKPSLNSAFVSEDPNGLDNALLASASVVDQFFGDFYFRYSTTRVMPLHSVPGLNRI